MVSLRSLPLTGVDLAVVAERDPVAAADLVLRVAVRAAEQLVEAELEARRAACRRHRGSRAGWPRRRRRGRCAAGRAGCPHRRTCPCRARRSPTWPGSRGSGGRRRRSGCGRSSRSACPARRSSRGRAARRGSCAICSALALVRVGSATTIIPATDSASGTPLRSRIWPRLAGSSMLTSPEALAIAAYDFESMPWSWNRRAPKTESSIATSTRPTRSRTCVEPRRLRRGGLGVGLKGVLRRRGSSVDLLPTVLTRPGRGRSAGVARNNPGSTGVVFGAGHGSRAAWG